MGKVDESLLWHIRMGNINFDNLVKLMKEQTVRGVRDDLTRDALNE
jgi:hypothetical protein